MMQRPPFDALSLRLFAVCLLVLAFYRLAIRPRLYSSFRDLPTAKGGWPLINYGPAKFRSPRGETYLQMMRTIPNSGLIHFKGFFNADHVLLTTPKAMSEVLVQRSYQFVKPPTARKLLGRIIGDSLLISEGDTHRYQRRMMQPYFNFRQIQDLYPIFWQKAVDLGQALRSQPAQPSDATIELDLLQWSNKATLDAIGSAALGEDLDTLHRPNELAGLYETVTSARWEVQMFFLANALLPSWALRLLPSSVNRQIGRDSLRLRELMSELIVEGGRETGAIFPRVMKSNVFSHEELIDQMLMIIGAGYHPTAAAFTWVAWFLASSPTWQSRLREEMQTNICRTALVPDTASVEAPLPSLLEGLPVLNAVCNETLRFMPTSPITTRVPLEDTSILGHFIPRGTVIYVVPAAINRSVEAFGPSADAWDPSRWLDTKGNADHVGGATSNWAFMTFLHGPRKCIGAAYARAEIRCFVAVLVMSFKFEMLDPQEKPVPAGVTAVKPRDGLRLRLRPVEAC